MKCDMSYKNSIDTFKKIQEILLCDEVVILGIGYTGKVVGYLLKLCMLSGKYTYSHNLKLFYTDLHNSLSYEISVLPFPVIDHYVGVKKNSVLIVATELEPMTKEMIKFYKAGFCKIIDGKVLANAYYNPIFFIIDTGTNETSNYCLEEKADILDRIHENECLSSSTLDKLKNCPKDCEAILEAVEHYEKNKNYLMAHDYCLRAFDEGGECNNEKIKKKLDFLNEKIQESDYKELDYILSMEKTLDINYLGRSGSIYFGSLLEGHKDIISLPPGIIYYPYTYMYALFCSKKAFVTIDELVDTFSVDHKYFGGYNKWIDIKVGEDNKVYFENYNKIYLDTIKRAISEEIKRTKGIVSEKFLIKAMHYAHNIALGRKLDFKGKVPYILNQTHTSDYLLAKKFAYLFPSTIILVTIRNIIQAIGSTLAGLQRENTGGIRGSQLISILSYYAFNPILVGLSKSNKIFLISLEKINLFQEETMKNVSKKLNISWDKCLLSSTINGQRMYDSYGDGIKSGNISGSRLTGISKTYNQYFNTFDRFRLEALFYPLLKRWGYDYHDFKEREILKELCKFPFKFEEILNLDSEDAREKFRNNFSKVYSDILIKLAENDNYIDNLELI